MTMGGFQNEEEAELMAQHVGYFVKVMNMYMVPDSALS